MLPRPVRAVVLDMDGTLCDTETLWRDAAFVVADELGVEMPMPTYLSIVGIPGAQAPAIIRAALPDFPVEEWIERTQVRVAASEAVLKPGVHELLDVLAAAGLPASLCTSSTHGAVARHLGGTGVLERLVAVVAAGDYPRGKPAPDPYLVAASLLGVPAADCLALEDSANGIRSARAAGCVTVMVPDLVEPTDDVRRLCDLVVPDLHAVRAVLAA